MWRCVALAGLLLASPALAADPVDHAGAYWISGVSEGAESCDVTLGTEPVIGGWSLELAKDCYTEFKLSRDIAAWTVGADGSVRFIDPLRKVLVSFEPVEIGGFVADIGGPEPIALDRAVNEPELTEQDRMSGQWVVTRMGGDIQCRLASTSDQAGRKGKLTPGAGCKAPWSSLTRWEAKGGRIQLFDGKGKVLLGLKGDSIEGFDGDDAKGELIAFTRDWTD